MMTRNSYHWPISKFFLAGTPIAIFFLIQTSSLLAQTKADPRDQRQTFVGNPYFLNQNGPIGSQTELQTEKPTQLTRGYLINETRQESEAQKLIADCQCQPRGTLFQWSYGTSFSGGPDREEPLITDRPDFTEAASTVGRCVAQLELGYTYVFDNDGTTQTKTHSYPETLLRYGILAEWLELRVGWNYFDEEAGATRSSGADDLYLGFKIGLTPQEGILPEMALIPQMTVPTGANVFSADEVLGGLNWIYAWEINDCISTGGSTQFNRALDEATGRAYTEWAQSWTIAYTLTDNVGAYTEYFAFFPHSADTMVAEHYFNGGFTYLINDDIQWDIRGGVGFNDAADDYFVGTGLSIRMR